jgi:3-methyladenine DNA glycosylase AlkD
MDEILQAIRTELIQKADEKTRQSTKWFFKEEILVFGTKTALVTDIGRKYFKTLANPDKSEVFQYCELLFKTGMMEEAFIACQWSAVVHRQYAASDIDTFEHWILSYVSNWAVCDTLGNHTIGTCLTMYPQCVNRLTDWTGSENRWLRRSAAISLILPARKGLFLQEILHLAELLLMDKDDLVQKGYGWMLKSAGELHQSEVYAFIMKNKHRMPRTALRYAIEKFPADLRAQCIQK